MWAKYGIESVFAYDQDGLYPNNTTFILPTDDLFILGIFNSKVIAFIARLVCNTVRGGYLEFNVHSVGKFPIPEPSVDLRSQIADKALECLNTPGDSRAPSEQALNKLVYQAYGLDDDDICVIEEHLEGQK